MKVKNDHRSTFSNLSNWYELNKLTSLPTCGFIAQLVEHRTGIAEVMGLNPVEARFFSETGIRLACRLYLLPTSSFQLLKLENILQ